MSNSAATLVSLLDAFDFSMVDPTTTSTSIDAVVKFLKKAEMHLANTVALSPPRNSTATTQQGGSTAVSESATPSPMSAASRIPTVNASSPISTCVDYRENFLDEKDLKDIKKELQAVKFVAMSDRPHSPEIALYGDRKYPFNDVSSDLQPIPINENSVFERALDIVNGKLGTDYNSILFTRYRTKKVALGWHKDKEKVIDNRVPISSLSVGAIRRFQISDSKDTAHRTQLYERELADNSILTMQPSLQLSHFHRVVEGRSSREGECGVRHSMTFRKLLPTTSPQPTATPGTPANVSQPSSATHPHGNIPMHSPPATSDHDNCADTLVFGSSLTKDLDSTLLSKRGKTFKIFYKGGCSCGEYHEDDTRRGEK